MLDNNHKQNPNCSFADDLISYIYGETSARGNSIFAAHLKICKSCSQEFEGFSVVRAKVTDWRQEEFSVLETPEIKIPYQTEKINAVSGSRLDSIRAFFTFPKMASVGAFALLAFFTGLFFLSYNFSDKTEFAGIGNQNAASDSIVEKEFVPSQEKQIAENKDLTEKPLATEKTKQTLPSAFETRISQEKVSAVNFKNTGARQSEEKSAPARNVRNARNSSTVNKNLTAARSAQTLRLTNLEDDEDGSIRLTDLFDEIGTE